MRFVCLSEDVVHVPSFHTSSRAKQVADHVVVFALICGFSLGHKGDIRGLNLRNTDWFSSFGPLIALKLKHGGAGEGIWNLDV